MNLSRAKSILILAFLGLNLFLGYFLLISEAERFSRNAFSAEELSIVESDLAEQDIFLEASVSRKIKRSSFLTVKTAQGLLDQLIETLGVSEEFSVEDGYTFYRGHDKELEVYPSGLIKAFFLPGTLHIPNAWDLNERDILRQVEILLEEQGVKEDTLVFDYLERSRGYTTLYYHQDHNGDKLFAGYLRVFLKYDSITNLDIFLLEPLEITRDWEMEVIPVTEALLSVAEELGSEPEPQHIIKADFGYFSRDYDAEKWEIPPVWRILTREGKQYYFNAFTGNLEVIELYY